MISKMLLNHNSEKICRNLDCKICDVLFEIQSQIVKIKSHFAMRYVRGNRSLFYLHYYSYST